MEAAGLQRIHMVDTDEISEARGKMIQNNRRRGMHPHRFFILVGIKLGSCMSEVQLENNQSTISDPKVIGIDS